MLFAFMNGGFTYDPATFVASASQHKYAIMVFCAFSFIGGVVQQIGAIRIGFKHPTSCNP